MTPRSLTVAVAVAALALGACGSDNSDEKEVKQAVKGIYNALADKDAKEVCDSISEKGKERIESQSTTRGGKKQSCEKLFGLGLAFAGDALKEARNVDVTDVTVDGDQAKATVSLQNRKSEVGLVKENGDWKLSGLDLAGR